jgi:DNA-binding transcriptional LysR family regulator
LRGLHILTSVVELGSMAQAAADFSVSQPAVSQAINDLEATLGVRLLDRGPSSAVPTMYGKVLVRRGLDAFDSMQQAMRDIAFLSEQPAGEVVIGVSESHIAGGFLAGIIHGMATDFPKVTLRIIEANNAAMEFAELREQRVDLMLDRLGDTSLDDDLCADHLFDEPLHLVAGAHNKWAHNRGLVLADLIDKPWVLGPVNTTAHDLVAASFARQGLQLPCPAVTTDSMNLRMQLLSNEDYVTAFPGTLVRYNADRWKLKVLPIDLGEILPVAIVTLRGRTAGSAVCTFIERTRHAANAMSGPSVPEYVERKVRSA